MRGRGATAAKIRGRSAVAEGTGGAGRGRAARLRERHVVNTLRSPRLGPAARGRSRGGPAPAFDGNPRAQAALGISPREMAVLAELAAGHSNKEIAARLHVSPNTVKTHVARLFEKLGARRRTDALRRARELGLVP